MKPFKTIEVELPIIGKTKCIQTDNDIYISQSAVDKMISKYQGLEKKIKKGMEEMVTDQLINTFEPLDMGTVALIAFAKHCCDISPESINDYHCLVVDNDCIKAIPCSKDVKSPFLFPCKHMAQISLKAFVDMEDKKAIKILKKDIKKYQNV